MTARCGTCGKVENVAKLSGSDQGIRLSLEPPWRSRSAKILGGVSGALVTLCSDICEERYGREIGFFDQGSGR
jgi:hypothetical protein